MSAQGPFDSWNDALGASGLAALTPKHSWRATSQNLYLPVRPPLGAEEAQWNYLEHAASDGTLLCGAEVPGSIEPSQPWFSLAAMINKIRNYPAFAAASGLHCVKDCAGGRAFFKAYEAYQLQHLGFDEDEPLSPNPPEPPLPPGFPSH